MKDKRNYLKIACIIEFIYIVYNFLYSLIFLKLNEEAISNIFMLIISTFFTVILYKESTKSISYLKNNNLKILICSIWLFIWSIIPGVLGFIFLSSIKDKKENMLPKIEYEKASKKTKIKSIILVLGFIIILFVLPKFSFLSNIPSYVIYIILLVITLAFCYKKLIKDFKIFINNFKVYLPFIIKRYFLMILIMVIVALPIVIIKSGEVSYNQKMINKMFTQIPISTLILSCIYAPITEESIFRLSLRNIFNNKTVFILVSGILFGLLHVINNITSLSDILYIFQYSVLGICLAKAYSDSNNIFVSISMHFIQNFLAGIISIFLL